MTSARLVPVVIIAASALLGLKVVELTRSEWFSVKIAPIVEPFKPGRDPFARDLAPDPIITGSSDGGHGAPAADAGHGPQSATPTPDKDQMVQPSDVKVNASTDRPTEAKPIPGQELLSEVEILKRLSERRKQLDKFEQDLQMRDNLLKATEDKIEKKVDQLKDAEQKAASGAQTPDDAHRKQITDLVKVYEAMKPKDAARVFDGLDTKLLVDMSRAMNPKKLADVVSKMQPEIAQKLTTELARNPTTPVAMPGADLPKIQGKASTPPQG